MKQCVCPVLRVCAGVCGANAALPRRQPGHCHGGLGPCLSTSADCHLLTGPGVGCLVSGLLGGGVGVTTYSENIGVIGITGVGLSKARWKWRVARRRWGVGGRCWARVR